jgi:hypothetical protein
MAMAVTEQRLTLDEFLALPEEKPPLSGAAGRRDRNRLA